MTGQKWKLTCLLFSWFAVTLYQLLGAGVFQKSLLSHAWDQGHVLVTQCMAVDSNSPCLSDVRDLAIHMNCAPVISLAGFYFASETHYGGQPPQWEIN